MSQSDSPSSCPSRRLDSCSERPPPLSNAQIKSMLQAMVGIDASNIFSIEELQSFTDRNYLIKINYAGMLDSGFPDDDDDDDDDILLQQAMDSSHNEAVKHYVLKILNSSDSRNSDTAVARIEIMNYLYSVGVKCSNPMTLLDGQLTQEIRLPVQDLNNLQDERNDRQYLAYLMNYIDGEVLSTIKPNLDVFCKIGKYAAVVDGYLQSFSDDNLKNCQDIWSLKNFLKLDKYLRYCSTHDRRYLQSIYQYCFEFFKDDVPRLRTAVIHNDLNDDNLIVKLNTQTNSYDISGIIDFGDADQSPLIFELTILIIHMMIICGDNPMQVAGHIIASYHSVLPLTKSEYNGLYKAALARLFQLIVLSEYEHYCSPDNDYVMFHYDEYWSLLRLLWITSEESVYRILDEIVNCSF